MICTPQMLSSNIDWNVKLHNMCDRYNISQDEVYDIIQGETWPKWNFASHNSSTNAAGAFQFIPASLHFINKRYKMNVSTSDVLKMSPVDQLELYDRYLRAWRYDGRVALGFMQAAPGIFYKMKRRGIPITDSTIVYERGSGAWKRNPGWREPNDGDVTIGSINRYYRKSRV